jgi:ech hydrogenase subunit D
VKPEEQPIRAIGPKDLIASVSEYHKAGYRFVQLCCTKLAENSFEMTYSFDKELKLENLRLTVSAETEIPSISGVYKGTFLYENEIRELFGVNIKGISIDFMGLLYKRKVQHPFGADEKKVSQ